MKNFDCLDKFNIMACYFHQDLHVGVLAHEFCSSEFSATD